MKTYSHLSRDERLVLFEWVREGCSQAEVARGLERDKGTVSRELRRNGVAPVGYLPDVAQGRYQARRQRCRPRLRLASRDLRRTVILLLERGWSPEQIAGRLRAEEGRTVVNHETLYRFIYDSPLGQQPSPGGPGRGRSSMSTCAGARRSAADARAAAFRLALLPTVFSSIPAPWPPTSALNWDTGKPTRSSVPTSKP
ncbi:MAG: helix-turn-helix domain-containing protein [Anaerolineales bacterium]|jgi:IS30 family transposase